MSYIFNRTLVLPFSCSKYGDNNNRIFKEAEVIEVLDILGLISNIK